MAEDGRTEKATPRKRREEKLQGNLAKSKELGTFFSLFSFGIILMLFGEWFVDKVIHIHLLMIGLVKAETEPIDYFRTLGIETVKIFIYIAFLGLVFQFINQMIQVGFLFSPKIIKPDFKKINPANYFKNLKSPKTFVEIIKSLFIVVALGYVVYFVINDRMEEISGGMLLPWNESLLLLWDVFKEVLTKVLIALFFIGLLDFIYQKYEHEQRIKMKKHEVKDEHKQYEGNPEMKRRQRQAAIQMLRKEVNKKIPEATFILTNPTHYSVAIRYRRGEGPPKVLVKGVDHMALYMREIAKENNIPIYEAPPLAREIYKKVGEGEFIPQELFQAIIDILKVLIKSGKINV